MQKDFLIKEVFGANKRKGCEFTRQSRAFSLKTAVEESEKLANVDLALMLFNCVKCSEHISKLQKLDTDDIRLVRFSCILNAGQSEFCISCVICSLYKMTKIENTC